MSEAKQVIVLRKDLNMRKGKMAAQAAHASMAAIIPRISEDAVFGDSGCYTVCLDKAAQEWLRGAFVKIVVSCDSEMELLSIYHGAQNAGINCSLIQDSGRTEFGGVPTYTAVAVGPAYPEKVNPLTQHLKLL